MEEIHVHLGHITPDLIRRMLKDQMITSLMLDGLQLTIGSCDTCEYMKLIYKLIGKVREPYQSAKLADEIHTDLWGLLPVQTARHRQYYASFTDDHIWFMKLYLLKTKSEVLNSYCMFKAWVSVQFSTKVKCLWLDRGGKYTSKEFAKHLKS